MHDVTSKTRFGLKFANLLAVAVIALAAAGCSGSAPTKMAPETISDAGIDSGGPRSNYRLGPGDRVHVAVFGQPEMTGDFTIPSNGQLAFPLIGEIDASGKTPGEFRKSLYNKLHPEYLKNPSVSVEVLNYRPFYIIGEVKQPGSYSYVADMTVLNAIALAGGFTYRANEDYFVLRRRAGATTRDVLQANADTPVLPGDIITVRERYF
jgi:polysaccharide export outer membrane protein